MGASFFDGEPDRIVRTDTAVLERATADDLVHIRSVWPSFERLVGLRGRRMFAKVDVAAGSYTVCTPRRDDDPDDSFGLDVGVLRGGTYVRGRINGPQPASYERIGPAMSHLVASVALDASRPLVEFYLRADRIELWVPVDP